MKKTKELILDCRMAEKAVHDNMHGLDHEEVWVLFLACDKSIISKEMLSKGTLSETAIDNRTVIKRALLNNAHGIVLFHNHPSGNPAPSKCDIQFTASLRKVCDMLDIMLLDHIILADDSFFSFSEEKAFES